MIFYAKNVPPAPPAARRSATKARSGVKAFRRRRQGCPPGCECAQAADLGLEGEAELPAARRRRRRDGGSRSLELADTGSCARRRAVSATTREKNPTPACAQPAVAPGTELPPRGATRRRSAHPSFPAATRDVTERDALATETSQQLAAHGRSDGGGRRAHGGEQGRDPWLWWHQEAPEKPPLLCF